jgi:hypothetical protein
MNIFFLDTDATKKGRSAPTWWNTPVLECVG